MSHSVLAAIVIPIVVIIALAAWLFLVYRAARHSGDGGHPETSHRSVPRRDVAGGAFRSRGGRQVMPRRDEQPAEMTRKDDL
jgi:hypothetical protein